MQGIGKKLIVLAAGVGLVLLVPMGAMQFSTGVNWGPEDFIAAGALLFVAGLAYVLLISKMPRRRLAIAIVIGLVFCLVWAEIAVGVFGTPWAGS